MAKQSITAPSYTTNNVSNLPDIVKNQATTVKTTFDKASVDIKAYETNLIAELNGNAGSKKIGHNSLNIASDNVGDAIEEVYQAITSTVLGEIPDNSITNNKLAVDAKVGSVASLTTTEKSTVVGAINEIDAYVNGVPEQVDTVETNLNILRTAKITTGSNVALAVDTDGTFDMTRNGNTLTVIPNVANTGAMTIAVDGQTARAIQKANNAGTLVALEAGDIKQNVPVQLVLQTSGTPVFIYAPKGGSNIKSIQRGMVEITSTTQNVTITAIDLTKSIVRVTFSGNNTDASTIPIKCELTTSTNVQLKVNTTGGGVSAQWEVIEFNNVKSKQSGSPSFGSPTGDFNTTISSINTSKSLLFFSFLVQSSVNSAGSASLSGNITTATNILFIKKSTSSMSLHWQVIEFN